MTTLFTKAIRHGLVSCCLLLTQNGFSQAHYPLAVGNRWDYGQLLHPGEFEYLYSVYVIGDTTMANGETYAIFQSTVGNYTFYQRQEGPRVFEFIDSSDSLLYDFSLDNGDTLRVLFLQGDTLVTTVYSSLQYVFEEWRPTWSFQTQSLHSYFYYFEDVTDNIGRTYSEVEAGYNEYCIGAVIDGRQYGTITGVRQEQNLLPQQHSLSQNYPNPFNPTTSITFDISHSSLVVLKVYDLLGREVATLVNEKLGPGSYTRQWDASGLSSGVYFYRLHAIRTESGSVGSFVETKKLIILR